MARCRRHSSSSRTARLHHDVTRTSMPRWHPMCHMVMANQDHLAPQTSREGSDLMQLQSLHMIALLMDMGMLLDTDTASRRRWHTTIQCMARVLKKMCLIYC